MELVNKINAQIKDLEDALERLHEVLEEENNESDNYIRDATILRFELTFEICWKLMKDLNTTSGLTECYSPKTCIRAAAQNGLIDNPEKWFEYVEYRNLVTHTYNQETAEKIYTKVSDFYGNAKNFLNKAKSSNM